MDQVDQIRRKTDIVELISEAVPLKKSGRNFKALCPFHEEKTPSFMVSPERQIFKCFGCQEGGDVYSFLMKREGLEFGEALRMLADRAGVKLTSFKPSKDQKVKERLLEINHLMSEYYHYLLTKHKIGKKALEYLLKRGITKSSIRLFKLGFAPNEWEGAQNYLVKKKGYKREELEQAGLVIRSPRKQGSFYDRFRDRVMFSLFDHRGRVVGFAGRVMDSKAREAKYVNSPETLIYHKSRVLYGLETTKEQIKKKNKAVVVEGELDAISSYQAGVKNVVAIKGSALTEEQIELVSRFSDNVALALDEDMAGDKAARRGIELAEAAGISVRVIRLKYGKDPDECAQKSAKLWKDSVKTAVPIYDFFIDSAIKRHGVKTPEGKRQVTNEVVEVIGRISNQVIKAHYVKKLAGKLGVGEEAVLMEVDKVLLGKSQVERLVKKGAEKPFASAQGKTRQDRLVEYVLALVLQEESEVLRLVKMVKEADLPQGAVKRVVGKLKTWGKSKKWEINRFVKSLPEELAGVVDEAYLTDLGKLSDDSDRLEMELVKTLEGLRKIKLKNRLEGLTEKIKEAEKKQDKIKLKKWQQQFVKLSRRLQQAK